MSSGRRAFVPSDIRVLWFARLGWVPLLCLLLFVGCGGSSTEAPEEEPVPTGLWWKVNGALTAKCSASVVRDSTVVLPNGQFVVHVREGAHLQKGRYAVAIFAADGSLLSQVELDGHPGARTLVSEARQRIVVMTRDGYSSADIYSMRFDGTDVQHISRDIVRWLALSPDGKTVAYIARDTDGVDSHYTVPTDGVDSLYTVPVEGGKPTRLPLGDDKFPPTLSYRPSRVAPRFSSDSQHLLYVVESGTLYSSKIDGSPRVQLSPEGLSVVRSSDRFVSQPGSDRVVYFAEQTETVYTVRLDGSDHRELIYRGEDSDCDCVFSPDGSELLVTALDHLHRVDIASGTAQKLFPSVHPYALVSVTADSQVFFKAQDASGKRNLYAGGLDGSGLTPLLEPWDPSGEDGKNVRYVEVHDGFLLVRTYDAGRAPRLSAVSLEDGGETLLSGPAGLKAGEVMIGDVWLAPTSSGPPWVVYQAVRKLPSWPFSHGEVFAVRLDGSGHTTLTPTGSGTNEAYRGVRGGFGDILVGPPIGGVPTVLIPADPHYEDHYELFAVSPETVETKNLSAQLGEHDCGTVHARGLTPGGLAFSPDGTHVAYAAVARTPKLAELYVAAVDGSRAARVSPDDLPGETRIGHDYLPVQFTDNSERLVFPTWDDGYNTLWSVGADGSDPLLLDRQVDEDYLSIAVDDTSGQVVYLRSDEGTTSLRGVPVVGGTPQQLNDPVATGFEVLRRFAILPDGSGVVYLVGNSDEGIHELHRAATDGSGSRKLADLMLSAKGYNAAFFLAPDGKHVVVTRPTSWRGHEFFSVSLAGGGLVRLTSSEDDARFLSFSRDSRWVAFWVHFGEQVFIVDVATGDRVYMLEGEPEFVGFTADSSKGVFWDEGRVRMVELVSGEVIADIAMAASPQMGPNGRYVYGYVERGSSARLHRLGEDGVLEDLKQEPMGFRVSDDGSQILLFVKRKVANDYRLRVMRSDGSEATVVPFPPLPVSVSDPSDQNYGFVPGNRRIWLRADLETEGIHELFAVPSPLADL